MLRPLHADGDVQNVNQSPLVAGQTDEGGSVMSPLVAGQADEGGSVVSPPAAGQADEGGVPELQKKKYASQLAFKSRREAEAREKNRKAALHIDEIGSFFRQYCMNPVCRYEHRCKDHADCPDVGICVECENSRYVRQLVPDKDFLKLVPDHEKTMSLSVHCVEVCHDIAHRLRKSWKEWSCTEEKLQGHIMRIVDALQFMERLPAPWHGTVVGYYANATRTLAEYITSDYVSSFTLGCLCAVVFFCVPGTIIIYLIFLN